MSVQRNEVLLKAMNRYGLALACFLAGILFVFIAGTTYLRFGAPPVAVTDAPFSFEKQIVNMPMSARIDREMPGASPVQPTPENLLAGAGVYREHCAFCHGTPGSPSPLAQHMYPHVPQLWANHGHGVVGVSDDPVGETYWKVKNGIRLTGMPAYAALLSEEQLWQVSGLLQRADQPLSSAVKAELAR